MRAFEQAAEIFFAGDNISLGFISKAVHGFIFHFEPLQSDDADVLSIFFPDLTLAKFHAA
jgi:hypothetical protein